MAVREAEAAMFAALHAGDDEAFSKELGAVLSVDSKFRVEHCLAGKTGDCLLHVAARLGSLQPLKAMLAETRGGIDLQVQNLEGKTPLHEASQFRQPDVVSWLLSKDSVSADPIKRGDWTPLMLACTKSDNLRVVQALVAAGADVRLTNKDGWTPFHLAARTGDERVIAALVKAIGGDSCWRQRSKNGRTPLHSCAQAGHASAVEWMLENLKFDRDEADSCGSTPLMDAARAGKIECATHLIEHGHSRQVVDKTGRNAFMAACHSGQTKTVKHFLRAFPDSLSGVSAGMTALHWAALEGHSEVVGLLLNHGADPAAKDTRGRTPADLARSSGHCSTEKILLLNQNYH